jgi:transcriptional regulator with XRE-family HTH domain
MNAGVGQVSQQWAANLRRERHAHGWSQEELAFRAGLHRTQISLLEKGNRLPGLITFIKLRGALGVSADALLVGIEFDPYVVQSGGLRIAKTTWPATPVCIEAR